MCHYLICLVWCGVRPRLPHSYHSTYRVFSLIIVWLFVWFVWRLSVRMLYYIFCFSHVCLFGLSVDFYGCCLGSSRFIHDVLFWYIDKETLEMIIWTPHRIVFDHQARRFQHGCPLRLYCKISGNLNMHNHDITNYDNPSKISGQLTGARQRHTLGRQRWV